MPVESAADRAAFVNPDEFGAAAIYTHAGVGTPVSGVFDRPFTGILPEGAGVNSSDPTFNMPADDLPAGADEEDQLQILGGLGAGNWTVAAIEPDGRGMVLLQLEAT